MRIKFLSAKILLPNNEKGFGGKKFFSAGFHRGDSFRNYDKDPKSITVENEKHLIRLKKYGNRCNNRLMH